MYRLAHPRQRLRPVGALEHDADERQQVRHQERAANALEETPDDENFTRAGGATRDRAEREHREPDRSADLT